MKTFQELINEAVEPKLVKDANDASDTANRETASLAKRWGRKWATPLTAADHDRVAKLHVRASQWHAAVATAAEKGPGASAHQKLARHHSGMAAYHRDHQEHLS